MELSSHLREQSRTIQGKEQLLIAAYAKALEVIPRQLCDNAGFDATNILNKLRQKHATGLLRIRIVCFIVLWILVENVQHLLYRKKKYRTKYKVEH